MKTMIAILFMSTIALADSLPSKMTLVDAAKLDAAFAHEQLIMNDAKAAAASYEREILRICALYKIDRNEVGRTVGIDTATGEITRKAPEPVKK
jgi:hypothetical protein